MLRTTANEIPAELKLIAPEMVELDYVESMSIPCGFVAPAL